jgi:hypothetical protein
MRTPRRTWKVLASVSCLSLAVATLRAEPDAPDSSGGSESAQQAAAKAPDSYQQIMQEYQKAQQAFNEVYRAAKDDAERHKIIDEKYPRPEQYAARLLAFAEKNPDDPSAIDSLVFVVSTVRQGAAADKALDRLTGQYIGSEKLASVCQQLGYSGSPSAEAALVKVMEQSPHNGVKAQACYALGQYHLNQNNSAEAEKRFEEVIAKYGDVKSYRGTLGEAATAQLHEARNLVVGKVAPEIEGEDVDGKAFKLSDYRGKVVVLDFWGDW